MWAPGSVLPGPSAERLQAIISRLPPGPLLASDYRVPELELFSEWDIACHYAPFDHVERAARVAIVGINPGVTQALLALAAARDALWSGAPWEQAQRAAKQASAFRGPLLTNLVRMLDAIDLPRRLEDAGVCRVDSSRELFASERHEVHATYCVRYPVAVNGRDYAGRRPLLLRSPKLRAFVFDLLGPELREVPDAMVVPLGRIAGEAVAALVAAGELRAERCLFGVPHPSGTNGHREADFGRAREELSRALRDWFAERGGGGGQVRQPASLESP